MLDRDQPMTEWREEDQWGPWPTPRQEMLLRASLLSGAEALEAWDQWKKDVDVDRVMMPSMGLLPLLYHNLLHNGVADPMMADLKKRYAATWYQNQLLLRRTAECVALLKDAGIETIVLKGAAMTLAYYKDHGVRPMSDVDLLVKPEDSLRAANALGAYGLESTTVLSANALRYMHGAHFTGGPGFAVDLHWQLLWEFNPPEAETDFWDRAVETPAGNVSVRVLEPTDQLFHVCVHGARWNSAPLRWIADAVTIVNTSGQSIDYERLAAKAEQLTLHLPIRDTLGYLAARWSQAVPPWILEALEAMPSTALQRVQYRNLASNRTRALLGILPMHLFRFLRITRRAGFMHRLTELPRFLAFAWRLERARDVPISILKKAGRRAWMAVRSAFTARSSG